MKHRTRHAMSVSALGAAFAIPLAIGAGADRPPEASDDYFDQVEREVDQLIQQAIDGGRPSATASPIGDEVMPTALSRHSGGYVGLPVGGGNLGLIAAADNILDQQCPNGGFNWPYGGCDNTFFNITAPITMGLLRAYDATGDQAYLDATIDGANHDLNDTWSYGGLAFSSFDPMWFLMLSDASGDPAWEDIAQDEFFERLSLGTYGDSSSCGGTQYFPGDTYDYIERHKCVRDGGLINLRAWDIQYMPYAASQIGFPDSAPGDGNSQQDAFTDAILDALDNLDAVNPGVDPDYFGEIMGLAGGVHALGLVNHSTFPAIDAPNYAAIDGIDTLCDLADVLAGLQNANGSWNWTSNVSDPSDADTQTTAYAILALLAAQDAGCGPYESEIADGRAWLSSMQDGSDGAFLSWPGGDKNIQTQGDVLMALAGVSELTLNSDECVTDGTLTVTIDKSETPSIEIVGGQFFLEYDPSVLSNPSISTGDAPFDQIIFQNVDETEGEIDLAVGVQSGDSGTEDAATMAVITFEAAEACTESDLVTFRPHDPPTRLSDDTGNDVQPVLQDLDDVTIDETGPMVDYTDVGGSIGPDTNAGVDSQGVLWRYADPGTCATEVNWTQPVAGTDYTDNCTADGDVTVDVISDFQPGDTLAAGQTDTVTYRFTDACGNSTEVGFDVEVVESSVVQMDIQNPGLTQTPVERCIEAEVFSPGFGSVAENVTAEFVNGAYEDWSTIPCDTSCARVRDPLHTLWVDVDLTVGTTGHPRANSAFQASASLTNGDLNGDNLIDILDFGVFAWQYGVDYGTGFTDCNTPFPHADLTGNGMVDTPEFTFISVNFLMIGDDLCTSQQLAGGLPQPRERISVEELRRMGLGHLAVADLTGDGEVGPEDIAAFAAGERPDFRPQH